MTRHRWHVAHWLIRTGMALALAGCGTAPVRAPVEARSTPAMSKPVAVGSGAVASRSTAGSAGAETSSSATPAAARTPAGAENAGKPGYYTVRSGDTLIRIGLDQGQNWRDVARWNGIENPNLIEVGQVLRVVPPPEVAAAAARPAPPPEAGRPAPRPEAAGSAPAQPASPAPVAVAGDEAVDWMWPAAGTVVASFDEPRGVKGLAIGGKAGDPVMAAADGRVVYAGSGLRGYGNLVIVKHNNTFLTAYAHNQALLVKEDQAVRRGQKIAEMGSTDADRVKLHFEIRRQGRPVDPARLLPAR